MRNHVGRILIAAAVSGSAVLYGCGGGGGGPDQTPHSQADLDRAAEEARKKAEEEARKSAERKKQQAEQKEREAEQERAEEEARTAADAAANAAMTARNAASAAAAAAEQADMYRMEATLDANKAKTAASDAEAKSAEAAEASAAAQTALAKAQAVKDVSEKVSMHQQAAMDSALAAMRSATEAANSATTARNNANLAVAAAAIREAEESRRNAGPNGDGTTGQPQPFDDVAVRLSQRLGEPTRDNLLLYLYSIIGSDCRCDDPGLARFDSPATVRIAEDTSPQHRALIHHAIAVINRELPYEWHVKIGSDAPALAKLEDIPRNQIFVDFAPMDRWDVHDPDLLSPKTAGLTEANYQREFDSLLNRWEKKRMNSAHVYVRTDRDFSHLKMRSILWHELLHALGLFNHVNSSLFRGSLLLHTASVITERIPEVDGAALRAIYTRYANGAEPEDLTPSSLGQWDSMATDLSGEIGSVSFGVRHRHGVGVPWTQGDVPETALAENRSITGTARWSGGLLGFTPEQRSVGGNTEISVDLRTMTGSADFTKLQSWPSGRSPGALGTGTKWGDGDLGYTIAVSDNYLRSTGGDDGVVAGSFYANDHSGVAGSLERSDLSAAFGAKRP